MFYTSLKLEYPMSSVMFHGVKVDFFLILNFNGNIVG